MSKKIRVKNDEVLQKETSKYAAYRTEDESTKEPEKPKNFWQTGARLLKMLKGNQIVMAIVVVFCSVGSFLTVYGTQYLEDIVDFIKEQVDLKLETGSINFSNIYGVLIQIFVVFFSSSICTFICHFLIAGVTQKLITGLRENINRKLSVLPLKYFDSHNKGDLLSRVTNDIDNINNTMQNSIINLINSIVTVIGVLVIMFTKYGVMTFAAITPVPFGLLAAFLILNISKKYFRRHWAVMGDVNGHIEEMFTGHALVKSFGHEKTATEEFRAINNNLCELGLKAQYISGILPPVMTLANNIGYVFICVLGGYMMINQVRLPGGGTLSVGGVTAIIALSMLFMQPLVDVAKIINQIQSSLSSAERVFDVLDAEEQVPDTVKEVIDEPEGRVELRHVDFSYSPDKPLIKDFNLDVEPGQLIAIVGPTGAGKTTIVNLLMRFYEVDNGGIYLDGINITDISRENLHNIFGMVLQDTWLFKGTVRENLMYGHFEKTEEEMLEACRAARVDKFVATLPEGYDTMLDEDGSNLSQGQKQLLTIARAILSDPKILILDEATSSVDTRTEQQIQEAMQNLMSGRTNFVIAHRLSTIRNADNIIFIKDGCITEHGNHEELLAKKGDYAELYYSQFND